MIVDTRLLTGEAKGMLDEFIRQDFKSCRTLGVLSYTSALVVIGLVGQLSIIGKSRVKF